MGLTSRSDSRMKVAFVAGCIEYSVCLANALARHCHLDFFYGGAYARQRDATILTLLDPSIGQVEVSAYRLRDPRNYRSYREAARRLATYDVVHLLGPNLWFNLHRSLYRHVPMVCTVHDPVKHTGTPLADRLFETVAQRASVAQAKICIVHGERLKAALATLHGIRPDDIAVLPHGELSLYRRLARPAGAASAARRPGKQLLFFGEVRKNKGLEYLVKAEPLISAGYADYSILVAGKFRHEKDNNLEYYRALMADPGRFTVVDRFIGNDEVADLFAACDIVVLPYISASQSGILALAFGFGKPVVATDAGSIGEVLEHGRTGLLVPPADERALAAAVLRLLRNDAERIEIGRNAAAVAAGRLSWDVIAKQTIEVYSRAVGG